MDFSINKQNLNAQNTTVLACGSLLEHLSVAQKKMGTDFPVIELRWELHKEPLLMREAILQTIEAMPDGISTLLVAMGYCGGAWNGILTRHRVVIPNLDDCVTMMLQTDDHQHGNLKQHGHIYFRDSDTGGHSLCSYRDEICKTYGTEIGTAIFGTFFSDYEAAEMIDTGAYDCYDEAFVAEMQKNADLIRCPLGYVEGSNRILEKLVSGNWDEQFLVIEPNHTVTDHDFKLGDAVCPRLLY